MKTDISALNTIRKIGGCIAMLMLLLGFMEVANAESRMYWTDAGNSTIQRANLDGTNVQLLVHTGASPHGIALDVAGGKMYWAEADGQKIRRANLDGTNVEDLVGSVGASAIALDLINGKVYWTDRFVSGYIQRSNLTGSFLENLNTTVEDRAGLALDIGGGKMYWTNRSWQSIERSNLDGTNWEWVIPSGLLDPRGLAIDNADGKLYWAELGTHKIRRANIDGSAIVDLVTGLGNPFGVALDLTERKIYWTDFGTKKIQRANLDGSFVEDVQTNLSIPVGIALEIVPKIITVNIDIKPESAKNLIHLGSHGKVDVAIFSTALFDARTINPITLILANEGVALKKRGTPMVEMEDVNDDGIVDLIAYFNIEGLELTPSDSQAVLEGQTYGGTAVKGVGKVKVIP